MRLDEKINETWDRAIAYRQAMQSQARVVADYEETAKMENLEEWMGAKNSDQRKALILRVLADEDDYHNARDAYADARDRFKIAMLEVERLRMLLTYTAGGGTIYGG